jgi:hypothetical protein
VGVGVGEDVRVGGGVPPLAGRGGPTVDVGGPAVGVSVDSVVEGGLTAGEGLFGSRASRGGEAGVCVPVLGGAGGVVGMGTGGVVPFAHVTVEASAALAGAAMGRKADPNRRMPPTANELCRRA